MSFTSPPYSKLSERLSSHRARDLAGLIVRSSYPEISSAIIPPLLDILVGGSFDIRDNFLIREPSVVLLILELLPKLSDHLQLELWRTLGDVFCQSLSNIHACRQLHLIERCLELLRRTTNEKVAVHVVRVIEIVGGYSISLKELRDILSYLYTGHNENWAPHSVPLVGALAAMAVHNQPEVFFTFSGTPGAAITLPPISKWPTQSGFSINLWFRLENPYDAQKDYYKPVVYWFRTSRPEHGYSSHFIGNTLILETFGKGQKRPQTHALDFTFACYRWYMLTVVYVHNRIKSSGVCCYVDGQCVLSADVSLPSTSDVYDKCFLGTSPSATEDVVFQGQLSAVYLFREPIKPDTVAALHRLGPSYKSQFRFEAETDVPLTPQQKKVLFDGHLSSVVCFSYNAKAVDGQLCLEASPNENTSPFSHSPHATLLEGVSPVVTMRFHTVLHSLGGVQALFPLLSQLDLSQSLTGSIEKLLCVKVLTVMFELSKNSTSCMLQLVQMNAMKLLNFLLKKVSPVHLNIQLVVCLFEFSRYLMDSPGGRDLLSQLIQCLLFCTELWINAPGNVQSYLYSHLSTELGSKPLGKSGLLLRDLLSVPQLMCALREHYSITVCGQDKRSVRPYILLLVKEFMLTSKSSQQENMQCILDYLCSVPEEEDIGDVLELLMALLFEQQQEIMVRLFSQCNGVNVASRLLVFPSEEITLHALKLIGKVLYHSSTKQQTQLIEFQGIFSVVREKILSARQPVTIAMFNTLFEVLVNCPSRRIIDNHYMVLDSSHQIWFPAVLSLTIELVCSLHTAFYDWEESDVQLKMQLFSYISSLCVQNPHNCKAVLRVRYWQHWLLALADQPGAPDSDSRSLQEMLNKFFLTMLSHCFREEQDGWRVWVETSAAIHSYTVSKLESEESSDSLDTSSVTELQSTSAGSLPDQDTPEADRVLPSITQDDCSDSASDSGAKAEAVSAKGRTVSPLVHSGSPSLPRRNSGGSSSRPSSARRNKPSPISLSAVPISRTSSSETPNSPFLIPRSPFVTLSGKMPKFEWTSVYTNLLQKLLKLLCSITGKWASSVEKSKKSALSEFVGDEQNKFLRSNVAQLLALTVDCVIQLNGGLKLLHSLACQSSKDPVSTEGLPVESREHLESLLGLSLDLSEVFVLSGLLKLGPVELRMKMEQGGMVKQALRLVMAAANLSSHKANIQYKEFHEHFHREKLAVASLHKDCLTALKSLGLSESPLVKYFDSCKSEKLSAVRSCQCLLSDQLITLVSGAIPREGESKALVQTMVASVFYYLSMLCVAKYQNILAAIKKEEKQANKATPVKQLTRQSSMAPNTKPLALQKTIVESEKEESPEPPETSTGVSLHARALDISDQIEASMSAIVPYLCRLLVEHKNSLAKVLVGSDGRALVTDAVVRLAENCRVVELTMLLCSQDWQASLEKAGEKLFTELLAEGKRVSSFSETYVRSVASKIATDLKAFHVTQSQKYTDFEEQLSAYLSQSADRVNKQSQLRKAELARYTVAAKDLWRKISSVVDDTGSLDITPLRSSRFWRLDLREGSHRERLQLLVNPNGTGHESAVRTHDPPSTVPEDPAISTLLHSGVKQPKRVLSAEDSIDELLDSVSSLELSLGEQDSSPQLLSLPCLLIMLAYAVPGTLVFTKKSMSFTADDSSDEYKKALELMEYLDLNGEWLLHEVTAVLPRRYLHQSKAVEIFLMDRTSVFFVFESSKDLKSVVRKLPKVGVGCEYGLPQTRSVSMSSPQNLFQKSTMTSKWLRRELSNFDYLMFLNTIAGRSYSDLNQYPVFPWVLRDYSSHTIDINDHKVYRDLTKPIGALNETRLKQFEDRFNSFEDESMPAFHYGTHYSTMAFVLHWLVRVEPYSSLHVGFHDGLFDHSSRMFSNVCEAWTNTNRDSSNVNELIPEFYYLPEMLLNGNKFEFGREGTCGEGAVVSDVALPPWAETAHDFIRINREALESDYVSANLHHWIDLIFGYKQRGQAAVDAKNVFYYLTYAGAVDLDRMDDHKTRKGLEEQIKQFGQTPAQLLKEPHPARLPLAKRVPPQPAQGLNPRDQALLAELQVTPDVPIALVQLGPPPQSNLLVISSNQLYAINKWTVNQGSTGQPNTVSLNPDPNIGSGLRMRLGDPLDQSVSASSACFASPPDCSVIFVCGFWDNSFKCFSTDSGKMTQSVFGHMGIVTCLDYSWEAGLNAVQDDGLIGTGSHDATVLLWRWCGRLNRVTGPSTDTQGPPAPVSVLTGHEQSVACVSLCSSLGLVVSAASKYGYCLVHSTSGELLHKVCPSSQWMHPHLVALTTNGHFVVHYADQKGCLASFTCNGKQLSQQTLNEPILALAVTKDGRFVITGGFDCTVNVFTAHNMKLKHSHERFDSSIRSLHISEDQKFIFAGLASGTIAVLATDAWSL